MVSYSNAVNKGPSPYQFDIAQIKLSDVGDLKHFIR